MSYDVVPRSERIVEDPESEKHEREIDQNWVEFVQREAKKEVERLMSEHRLIDLVEPMGFLIDRMSVENIKVFVFETKIRELGQKYAELRKQLDKEKGPEYSDTPEMLKLQKEIVMFVNLSRQSNDNRVAYKNAITKKFKEVVEGKDKGLIEARTFNG